MNPETGLSLQTLEADNPITNGHSVQLLLLGGVSALAATSLPQPDTQLSAWLGAKNLCAFSLFSGAETDAPPAGDDVLHWITEIGGNLVSLAGYEGALPQSWRENSKIETFGAGQTEAEAFRPIVRNVDGVRIGLLAYAERRSSAFDGRANILHPLVYDRVRMLQAQCDHVVVFCHAGLPKANLPLPEWRERYRRFVDAGASVVVGQLPSGVSGWEEYRNGLVFYGLGALADGRAACDPCSLAVSLSLERNGRFRYEARLLECTRGTLQFSSDESVKNAINETNSLFLHERAYLAQSAALCDETYENWARNACGAHLPGLGRGLLHALLPLTGEPAKRAEEANLLALLEDESLRLAVRRALATRKAKEDGEDT